MDKQSIASHVKAGAKRLRWITELADALDEIGSLEAAQTVAAERVAELRAEIATSETDLEAAKEAAAEEERALGRIRTDQESEIRDHKCSLEAMIRNARNQADSINSEARAEAKEIIARAHAEAADVRKRAVEVNAQIEGAAARLAEIKTEHKAVVDSIAEARAAAVAAMRSLAE